MANSLKDLLDKISDPASLKERALMVALEYIAEGMDLGLSAEAQQERNARIIEAAKIIHRATNREELKQGIKALHEAYA